MSYKDEITIKVGFGDHTENLTVRIADNDIPPYQMGERLDVVGGRNDRADAVAKVTGAAKFTYDRNLPKMLYGRIIRCPHPNADIKSVDLSRAKAMKGVHAVLDFTEVFRTKSIRYAWEGVAAIAAESEHIAEEAARAVQVEYDVLDFAVKLEASMEEDAPQVGRGNETNVVTGGRRRRRGGGNRQKEREQEVSGLLAKADKVIEATFTTEVQTHSSLESHGVVCDWDGDNLLCYASTQATFNCKSGLSRRPVNAANVRVMSEYVGGGFGSKFSIGREGVTGAMLAKQAGRPVKMMVDRKEEHTSTGNRPSSVQKLSLGVMKNGDISGYRVRSHGSPGAGARGAGAANDVIYGFGTVDKVESTVRLNAGGSQPMRAPGWPQGVFAMEVLMEMAADAVGMDSLEFRKKHDSHAVRNHEYAIGAERIGWKKRKKAGSGKGPIKTGIGMASTSWYNAGGRRGAALCRIHKNGSIEIRNGAQDIGTGTRTIMGMVCAEELGVSAAKVQTFIGDTNDPVGPASGGSTTAATLTPAVRLAAHRAKNELLQLVAQAEKLDAKNLDVREGKVVAKKGKLKKKISFERACSFIEDVIEVNAKREGNYGGLVDMLGGCQFAEVDVDVETGEVHVRKVVAVQDSGVFINKKTSESQIRGGVIQGISFALHENRIMDRAEGRMINADFESYKITGPVDCPEIDVVLVDVFNGKNTTSCMGLGEAPKCPTAGAIANAIHNATGAWVKSLPITPAVVLEALAEMKKG